MFNKGDLKTGESAPDFTLATVQGSDMSLKDIQKKLNGWFHRSGDSTEASEGDKSTGSS